MPHPNGSDHERQLVAQRSDLTRFARLRWRNDARTVQASSACANSRASKVSRSSSFSPTPMK
ncbi:hypothetical protein H010_06720 [Hydrogenophaga taeniospiralis CCUG 15921]|uniref:Uncharacterized protein n=1 Tax=Hydrogenophaga taeniospiralis CCUG 15921 TaxID=1281780 RepID=A0A9X4SED0_9BURK|nr:hypothetical protein [Hydrogenophaga taeniospiralis CCUG 15921]